MKRTVFHTSKQFLSNPFNQPSTLFPFLNSNLVQSYSKSIVRFKKVHALCNLSNIESIVPLPQPCKQFIFFGRSNVGKSTLLNKLAQFDIAAVSKRPGKTKDLLFCQLGSNRPSDLRMIQSKIYFIDAPGYGFATGVSKSQINKWGKLVTTYLKRTNQNAINQKIFCLLDVNHELKQTDAILFQLLRSQKKNFQIIFTKCDKFSISKEPEGQKIPSSQPLVQKQGEQKLKQEQLIKKGIEVASLLQQKYRSMNYYVHFTSSKTMIGINQLRNHIMFDIVSNKI